MPEDDILKLSKPVKPRRVAPDSVIYKVNPAAHKPSVKKEKRIAEQNARSLNRRRTPPCIDQMHFIPGKILHIEDDSDEDETAATESGSDMVQCSGIIMLCKLA